MIEQKFYTYKCPNGYELFNGLQDHYDQARPHYPDYLIQRLFDKSFFSRIGSHGDAVIADVASGTGILTRALSDKAGRFVKVYGIEPCDSMRNKAIEQSDTKINFLNGIAEKLPFSDESIDLITVGQAAHWFNRKKFYAESIRVLKKTGSLAFLENNRDYENSEFVNCYEKILEDYTSNSVGGDYYRNYRLINYTTEMKPYFNKISCDYFNWTSRMNLNEFLIMANSSTNSRLAILNVGEEKFNDILRGLFLRFEINGFVNIPYQSKMFFAKK